MMTTVLGITVALSVIFNFFLIWYLKEVLSKLFFVSENIADLYFATKTLQIFSKSMYGMDTYHGEPIIQELIIRIQEVDEEIEKFREIFEYTIDEELEKEFNDAELDMQSEE